MESMEQWHKPGRGKYVVDAAGKVVPFLPPPEGVTSPAGPQIDLNPAAIVHVPPVHIMGPTRIAELLMIDVRAAEAVPKDSQLWAICHAMQTRGALGIVESTIVIDLLDTGLSEADRAVILDTRNWPAPR